MSKDIHLHVGDSLEAIVTRVVDAWRRAERGELTGDNAEVHIGFESWETMVRTLSHVSPADGTVTSLSRITSRPRTLVAAGKMTAVWPSFRHVTLKASITVRIIHTIRSAELIREMEKAGWTLKRIRGSHHVFVHPSRRGIVVVPHPKRELGVGLVVAIRKQAGL